MGKLLLKKSWRIDPWLGVVLICFALFAWASWGKLAHPIFDTGQEAEIAARLMEGQVLYRDLLINYTPLPYYVNALLLRSFGHHLEVFYMVGLVLALTVTLLCYRLVKQLTNPSWAALCASYILIYCAFNPGGLYNLVAPYSYGVVYATVFCLLALMTLDRYGQTGRLGWLLIAAIASGLAGLAKQEYGVAMFFTVLIGANLRPAKSFTNRIGRNLLITLVTVSFVFLPLAWFVHQSSWQQVYTSLIPVSKARIFTDSGLFYFSPARTLVAWNGSFKTFVATSLATGSAMAIAQNITSYLRIDEQKVKRSTQILIGAVLAWFILLLLQIPISNVPKAAIAAALVIASGLAMAIFWYSKSRYIPNTKWTKALVHILIVIPFAGLSLYWVRRMGISFHPLGNLVWLLPLLVGWFAIRWRAMIQDRHAVLLWSLLTFSILVNSRFWFNIDFYGIYSVSAILLFFILLYQLANWTKLPIWNYVLVSLLIGGGMHLAKFTQYRYPISSFQGTLYTDQYALANAYNHIIRYIKDSGVKSVLVVPAGAILNFLTATHSPSKETIFLPGILPNADAERKFLAQMRENPPELIINVNIPFSWLKKGYQTYAEFNPLVDNWITHQHQLVYSSPKLVDSNGKEWILRIYVPS